MTGTEPHNEREPKKEQNVDGKTIDLQGVASFAALVELLAQELGTIQPV